MKILHVVRQFSPSIGGLEDYVFNLAIQQLGMGHRVKVLTLDTNFQTDEKLQSHEVVKGIEVERIPWKGSKRYSFVWIKPSRFKEYDVVHVHAVDFFIDYFAWLKKLRLLKPKLVLTTHGGFFHTPHQQTLKKVFFNTVTRLTLWSVDKVLTISPNDHAMFSKIRRDCKLIPNGVAQQKFGKPEENRLQKDDLVYLGRLSSNKKLDWLIAAFSNLKEPRGQLKIIGNAATGDVTVLQEIIERFHSEDRVKLLLNISDEEILEHVSQSRYTVSASEYEGFGLSVIELMSYGLLPFLSDTPDSFVEFVNESECGVLFGYDQSEFESAYAELIEQWSLEKSEQAIAYAQRFSWQGVAETITQEYDNGVKGFRPDIGRVFERLTLTNEPEELIDGIVTWAQAEKRLFSVGFINQHAFNLMAKTPKVYQDFLGVDYLLRDGIGMKMALKAFDYDPKANLNGTDLIPEIVSRTQGENTHYFIFGTESPWLETGSANLIGSDNYQVLDGFQDPETYVAFLKSELNPEKFNVVILAMGMPKQESVANRICQEIESAGLVICGGAIIDFQANRFERAPQWIRSCSLEWLYRLLKEPKRLFKRYVIGIPLFFKNLYCFK